MVENTEEKKDSELLSTNHLDSQIEKNTLELLIAKVIPTSKFFEVRFNDMESQVFKIKNSLSEFKDDTAKRFDSTNADVIKRFDDVGKQFDGVYKRFDVAKMDLDKRFDKVLESIEKLGEKIDRRDERQRNFTLRMFSIAISISILGVLGVFLKMFGIV